MRKVEQFLFVNKLTGESYNAYIFPQAKIGGKWVRVFQDTAKALLIRTPLRGKSLTVLIYLTSVADWNNQAPSTFTVAQALKMSQSSVSRAYADLIKAEFLLKHDKQYYLNPLYCWKGRQKQWEESCLKLLASAEELKDEKT